jgi:hypothetical protein
VNQQNKGRWANWERSCAFQRSIAAQRDAAAAELHQ